MLNVPFIEVSMRRPLSALFFSLLLSTAAFAQTLSPDAETAMQQGRDYEAHGELTSALASFHAAAKASNDARPALEAIASVESEMGDHRAARAAVDRLNAASTTPAEHAQAMLFGARLEYAAWRTLTRTDDGKPSSAKGADALLADAAHDAQASVDADATNEPARVLLARILAAQNKTADAAREFAACAAISSAGKTECARNLRLAANLDSARHAEAPAFTATTLDGNPVSRDSLAGKVVLLDFWATWCVYCHRDSDYVQSLLDSFPSDKFVLLEVNVEDDPAMVRNYIEDNRLDGVQVQDRHKQLQQAFAVSGFPTYVILDANGSERLREVGARGDLRGTVRSLLAETNTAAAH